MLLTAGEVIVAEVVRRSFVGELAARLDEIYLLAPTWLVSNMTLAIPARCLGLCNIGASRQRVALSGT
jgi:hypothetical protein